MLRLIICWTVLRLIRNVLENTALGVGVWYIFMCNYIFNLMSIRKLCLRNICGEKKLYKSFSSVNKA